MCGCVTHFSEEIIVNSAADANNRGLSSEKLLDFADDLRAPRPGAVLKIQTAMLACLLMPQQCSAAAVAPEASPGCHSASCLQDGGRARLSVWLSAEPHHSARCSSPRWPAGRFKHVRYDLREEQAIQMLTWQRHSRCMKRLR